MARLERVFIDTSELFPFTIMDVLLTLSEDFLFTWVWTDELLEEWEEVIVREGRRRPESAASVVAAVRTHFGRYRIDPAVYREKITDDLSPDPDDRAHAASAPVARLDLGLVQGGAMNKKTVSASTRRQFVVRSTKASARLERRVVPADHVRSAKVEKFVESLRAKA